MSTFTCDTCYDTCVIDQGGREIACPDCQPVTIKLTGLSHGAGGYGVNYTTAVAHTSSTITFQAATRAAILADARRVRDAQVGIAKRQGLSGRNHVSSWAIAIHERLHKAVTA